MKNFLKLFIVLFFIIFTWQTFAQEGKAKKVFYTEEEILKMCGVPIDPVKMKNLDAKQESMYQSYLSTLGSMQESDSISWRKYMSDVDDQEEDPCCGVFAAVAVVEGQLQILHLSRIGEQGINLDELEIYDSENPWTGMVSYALGFIKSSKNSSEIGLYPNYEGLKWTILTATTRSMDPNYPLWGIDRIQEALEYGPVTAEFKVYEDFPYYYWSHPDTAVYHWNGTSPWTGYNHAVAIAGYYEDSENPLNSYWLCKNSWGDNWGDDGYFRMGFGECGIETINNMRVTVDNTCYAKITPDLQTFLVAMNSWWTNNEKAYVLSNTTINIGETVVIPSDAYLIFSNNTSLIVNGTLTANGGSDTTKITFDFVSPNGSYQNGIRYNSGSGGSLSYCNIKNAYYGVYCFGCLRTIQHCTITGNRTGIRVYNAGSQASKKICYNNIHNNSSNGIFVYNSKIGNVYENIISNNGECGIYCTSNGVPYLWQNIITDNSQSGVYCIINSPALFGDKYRNPGNNLITQNYYGVTCGIESDVIIGKSNLAAYNSIYSNSSYEVIAGYDSYVMAEYNWWNRPSYPYYYSGDFYSYYGSSIDYIPALDHDPLGGMMKTVALGSEGVGSDQSSVVSGDTFFDVALREALNALMDGHYEEAIEKYVHIYNKENKKSKKRYILSRIAECYELSEKEGFIDFLNKVVRKKLSKKDELYAKTLELENYVLMREGKFQEASDNYLTMKNKFAKNEAIHKNALFNLGYLYYVALDNRAQGKTYFEEFIEKYPDDDLNLIVYETMGKTVTPPLPKRQSSIHQREEKEISLPNEFALHPAFPNPFNPTTTIAYDLPAEASVILIVYDITGREVARLVDAEKPAGFYQVTWDGRGRYGQLVSSGVYLYQIHVISVVENGVTDFSDTGKMIYIR